MRRWAGKRRRVALAAAAMTALAPGATAQHAAGAREQAAVAAGEAVYNNNCQTCHGDGLVSSGQTFDLRRLTADDRARFETSVRDGKNQMPPWKDVLSDEEIDQLWHYIRANAHRK
jgi:mono/diheme cytochrome c family protein